MTKRKVKMASSKYGPPRFQRDRNLAKAHKVNSPRSRFGPPRPGRERRTALLYSSCFLGDGGAGSLSLFTIPKGQEIPALVGGIGRALPPYLQFYTEATTSLTQAGQTGVGFGNFTATHIGAYVHRALPEVYEEAFATRTPARTFPVPREPFHVEVAKEYVGDRWVDRPTLSQRLRRRVNRVVNDWLGPRIWTESGRAESGLRWRLGVTDYGATPADLDQILQTMSLNLKVCGHQKIAGPLFMFALNTDPLDRHPRLTPDLDGGLMPKLSEPVEIAPYDQLEGVLSVCGPGQALKLSPVRGDFPRLVLVTVVLMGTSETDIR